MSETRPLSVRGLSHRFGGEPTLDGVDLTVDAGQVVSVLGPSGSGKTTLLRSIAGFATPSAGEIVIDGVTVFSGRAHRVAPQDRRVGMVFQDYALFPHMTVADNVAFGVDSLPESAERVSELLKLVGLTDLTRRKPAELSGGQQQRVALARALAPRPALLLLDEPFANLDADRRTRLIGELIAALDAEGTSALLVTHNRFEALAMSDRVAVIGAGETGGSVLQTGTPEEVYWRPVDEQAARITGDVQWVDGDARGAEAHTPLGPARLLEERHGAVRVLLRPESLAWGDIAAGAARVVRRQFVGRGYRLWCETHAGELTVECAAGQSPETGARGSVSIVAPCWALPAKPAGGGER